MSEFPSQPQYPSSRAQRDASEDARKDDDFFSMFNAGAPFFERMQSDTDKVTIQARFIVTTHIRKHDTIGGSKIA
jgi:hypothetical protein